MPKFTIDGKEYEFEGRHKLLQFALDHGVEIPYFCYHPAMSSPTNCRMCLVDVGFYMKDRESGELIRDEEGNPKIQWGRKPATACNQDVVPDMVVRTHRTSPEVKKMQEGVLEYMLVNHPLDCPICDQAGECPLQIWTYKYGPEGSRFEGMKVHKPKRVELGPNVILDAERCINCTRCTRFTEEISKSDQLSIIGRGEKNYPATAPGKTFDDPYSMNTVDLCPVGALTSKHFRFKARTWEMKYTPGIDVCDSTGTNIDVWVRDNKVMRLTPRFNEKVNQHWMPDAHRLDIDKYNENRISGVRLKDGSPVEFTEGLGEAANLLKQAKGSVLMLGSAYASLESNYALRQLAKAIGGADVYYIPHVVEGFGDGWLIQDDRTPNSAACKMLGFKEISIEEVQRKIASGSYTALYSLENDRLFSQLGSELEKITAIIHGYQYQPGHDYADILLPAATSIEAEGIYINKDGLAQMSRMAKEIKQMTPEMWMRLPKSRTDKAAVAVDRWRNIDNVFDVLPSWKIIAGIAKVLGNEFGYRDHHDIATKVKNEFREKMGDFEVTYKIPKEAFKITQWDFAIK